MEAGELTVVGVNRFPTAEEPARMDNPDYSALEARQKERLAQARAARDPAGLDAALGGLARAAEGDGPLMAPIIEAVKARGTVGEISAVLSKAWGHYQT
jgi:methylmalonyl-CoA mutase N-terminal domain/subunit